MKLITVKKLKKSYSDRELLDIDKFEMEDGEKIGIVGENGVGKSTFLKIILGEVQADEGSINLTDSYYYISQLSDEHKDCTESKIKKTFNTPDTYEDYLSGGEKVKMKVVNALNSDSALIIADEPTSNLDNESIKILTNQFKRYKGALLVVSHDREFLDNICNKILEVEDGKIKIYKGNYSKYINQKEEEIKTKKREYQKYISEKERLEHVIEEKEGLRDRIHKAPKGMGKSEAKTIKMGDQGGKKTIENSIKNVEKRIKHLEVKEAPKEKEKIIININEGTEVGSKNLIEITDYDLYAGKNIIINKININIKNGVKAALIGENGSGKTTLLKAIMNRNDENIKVAPAVKIGYFDQNLNILDDEKTILENIKRDSKWDESFIRINLGEFGFKKETVYKLVKDLSGGERVKAAICKVILSDNNLLILDEPTNYLDIKTIESLENALINTNKTLILVSHDKRFISNICNYIIQIKDGNIEVFEGEYNKFNETTVKDNNSENKDIKDKLLILENRLTEVISLLSIEQDEDKKKELDTEFFKLTKDIKELKQDL